MFSNFCFDNPSSQANILFISDIVVPDSCKMDYSAKDPLEQFHKSNCELIRYFIKVLQKIEIDLRLTEFGIVFRPMFVLVGSIAELTKVGSIANELDVTVQFEVEIEFLVLNNKQNNFI